LGNRWAPSRPIHPNADRPDRNQDNGWSDLVGEAIAQGPLRSCPTGVLHTQFIAERRRQKPAIEGWESITTEQNRSQRAHNGQFADLTRNGSDCGDGSEQLLKPMLKPMLKPIVLNMTN
jgi:hypothetical protein